MSDPISDQLSALEPGQTASIVEQICGPNATPIGLQTVERIGKKSAGAGTKGIYHVAGTADEHGSQIPWSAVVKAVGGNEGYSQNPDQSLDREIEVYRSGVFLEPRGGFRAARCYAVQEIDRETTWLWLEDLTGALVPPWPAEQYPISAQHLAGFNAGWTGQQIPNWDWLNPVEKDVGWGSERSLEILEEFINLEGHPFMRAVLSSVGVNRVRRLPDDDERIRVHLGRGDRGVCHLDAHPKNFFVLDHETNNPTTVAADWSTVGTGPLGSDLGLLLLSPVQWLELSVDEARELVEPVFGGYLQGLHDAGWDGDESLVRLEFLTHCGIFGARRTIVYSLRWAMNQADRDSIVETVGLPMEEIMDTWGEAMEFFLELIDEAVVMARELER